MAARMAPGARTGGRRQYPGHESLRRRGGLLVLPQRGARLFFNVGAVPLGQDLAKAAPNHSPNFMLDESSLVSACARSHR